MKNFALLLVLPFVMLACSSAPKNPRSPAGTAGHDGGGEAPPKFSVPTVSYAEVEAKMAKLNLHNKKFQVISDPKLDSQSQLNLATIFLSNAVAVYEFGLNHPGFFPTEVMKELALGLSRRSIQVSHNLIFNNQRFDIAKWSDNLVMLDFPRVMRDLQSGQPCAAQGVTLRGYITAEESVIDDLANKYTAACEAQQPGNSGMPGTRPLND